jgi:hypothetical protein
MELELDRGKEKTKNRYLTIMWSASPAACALASVGISFSEKGSIRGADVPGKYKSTSLYLGGGKGRE